MKKIYLLLLMLVWFFGSTFADDFVFNSYTPNTTLSTVSNYWWIFNVKWLSWNLINLYSVWLSTYNTCNEYDIFKYLSSTTSNTFWIVFVASWIITNITWTQIIDVGLYPWSYIFNLRKNWWWSCNVPRNSSTALSSYWSWFFEHIEIWFAFNVVPNYTNYSVSASITWPSVYTFSGSDPTISSINIVSNLWTTTFTGSTIYINAFQPSYLMSWSDIVFNIANVYRALFRTP